MAIFTIKNKFLALSVNSFGAEASSLQSNGEEYIWQANKDIWPRHAPVLFPVVGKLKNDQYHYKGINYEMSQHGFARDREFLMVEQTDNTLEFELTDDEASMQVYPFHFSLRIRYELNEKKLEVKYIVFNPDNKPLLFSIGAHPGFSCRVKDQKGLGDYYLEFEKSGALIAQTLEGGLQSGSSYEISLQNNRLPLSKELFDNDAIVLKDKQINSLSLVSKSGSGIGFTCKDWPYFGIWTKKGSDDFVCLEPWYGIADHKDSNGDLEKKEGILKLEPHQSFTCVYSLEIFS